MKPRLDTYERLPSGMEEYLSNYGWHFSKKMAEWAVSLMTGRDGEPVRMKNKDVVCEWLKENSVDTKAIVGYDAVYVEAMARADFYGSSILDEAQLAKFVSDYLGDPDGYDGVALTRFYADCMATNTPVFWEEML